MKSNENNSKYHLTFKNFTDLSLSDSLNKIRGNELISDLNELKESYIIFGNYSKDNLSLNKTDFNFLSHYKNGNIKNTINQSKKVIMNYFKKFNKPKINMTYTILFTNSTSFSAIDSGFFTKNPDIRFIAHELFHLWQKDTNDCKNRLLYKEGLAAYLEYLSLYELGYVNLTEFEKEFDKRRKLLSEVNQSLFFRKNNLDEFRKENPNHYAYFIYYKGSLIWKQIDQENNISVLFNNLIKTNNCSRIDKLINEKENILYNKIYKDS